MNKLLKKLNNSELNQVKFIRISKDVYKLKLIKKNSNDR